ncbi:alpha/beta hydrolase [Methylobacterium platani JCM 14648]|uniref:Alpha/beta hydrolase n=1 Tax=Methylobacterium platani JCM 14648 TaxID=1295136 RepID=A0ABR5H5R6_9HYPH|nr:alpha/beta hydrolase [Methylobacterium platani]KMO18585.1 alpha/beta hydrolase [Methylobacterium platani JCM 14648]
MAAGLLVAVLALYGAVIAAFWWFQRGLLYPGQGDAVPATGARLPAAVAGVTVPTADGERLRALWLPPAPGAGVVVSFHGNASLPEWHAERFAAGAWRARGWGVMAPAYRGYPGSTGRPSEAGLIADGLAAVAEARRRAPGAPVLLHGHSLGAAVAVAVAARIGADGVLGLYLEAPFDSMTAMARHHFRFLPAGLLADTWRSDRAVGAVAVPILIVHGESDPVIPEKYGARLARLAGADFVPLPGDHVSILGDRDAEAEARFRPSP